MMPAGVASSRPATPPAMSPSDARNSAAPMPARVSSAMDVAAVPVSRNAYTGTSGRMPGSKPRHAQTIPAIASRT